MDDLSKKDMNQYYSNLLRKYGTSPKALAYNSSLQQIHRYSALTNIQPISKLSSVLDVGCGLGYLSDFLRDNGWQGNYTGIDINPDIIQAASERRPSDNFLCKDLLTEDFEDKFDYVFCGATLQHKPKYTDALKYLEAMIVRMFSLSYKGLAFDVFTNQVDYEREVSIYVSPSHLLELCYRLTNRLVIRHDFRPYEIMVYLYNQTDINELNIYQDSGQFPPTII